MHERNKLLARAQNTTRTHRFAVFLGRNLGGFLLGCFLFGFLLGCSGFVGSGFLGIGLGDADHCQQHEDALHEEIGHQSTEQAPGDRVGEGHDHDGHKGRQRVVDLPPLNVRQRTAHEGTDDDQGTAGGPGGDAGKDGGKKDRDKKVKGAGDRRQTGASPGLDTGGGLDIGGDRAQSEDRPDDGREGVDGKGLSALREVSLLVGDAEGGNDRQERSGRVEKVDEEEGDQRGAGALEVARELGDDLGEGLERHDVAEVVEAGVADVAVGEVGHGGVSEPRDDGHEHDADDDSRVFLVGEHDGHDHHAQEAEPGGGAFHFAPEVVAGVGVGGDADALVGAGFVVGNDGGAEFLGTPAEGDGGGNVGDDDPESLGRLKAQMGQKGPNGGGRRQLDGFRDELGDGETDPGDGQDQEDGTLDDDGRHGGVVGHGSGAPPPDDRVGEVGVHSHAGSEGDGEVGQDSHQQAGDERSEGRGGDVLAADLLHAGLVLGSKDVPLGGDAGTPRVGEEAGVDGQDVGHRQEGGGPGLDLGGKGRLALSELEELTELGFADLGVEAVDGVLERLHGSSIVVVVLVVVVLVAWCSWWGLSRRTLVLFVVP
mmetsp:Transcript_118458/g.242088  ORF Transcript_118458/g.242088 Transcript_118458/m.242088 type:complete len:597 (-) Transcript_118458:172-1962(-)